MSVLSRFGSCDQNSGCTSQKGISARFKTNLKLCSTNSRAYRALASAVAAMVCAGVKKVGRKTAVLALDRFKLATSSTSFVTEERMPPLFAPALLKLIPRARSLIVLTIEEGGEGIDERARAPHLQFGASSAQAGLMASYKEGRRREPNRNILVCVFPLSAAGELRVQLTLAPQAEDSER
ncbi:hypothetical protein DFH06DRAFT_1132567 [Mycena polygramma]|nr:hypothetical protein DFH06DRAFT_1132567 [Mycena polygramma]